MASIWLVLTISDYILIVAVTQWYFNVSSDREDAKKLKVGKGLRWAFRYNFGSLVMGSLILSWLWVFRAVFNYIQRHVTDEKGRIIDGPTDCMRKCLKCFMDCHNRFVKYTNINAYC